MKSIFRKELSFMRKLSKKSNFNPMIVRIVGILLFIGTFVVQGQISRKLPPSASGGINGIISQLQVLISVAMVVMIPKKGYYTSLVMCVCNSLYILIFGVLVSHNPGAAPGVLSPVITLIVCTLIQNYSLQSYKAQEELEKRNSQLVDTNEEISKEGERLSRIIYNDELTGLYNQDMFKKQIEDMLNEEDVTPFTVVFTEIDDFDALTKRYTSDVTDMILTTFGYRLHNFCGNSGVAARISGAEFAFIIVGQRNRESVSSYLSDLVAEVCEPIPVNGKLLDISISTGVAHYPRDGRNSKHLIENADNAVKYAKEKCKGSVYFFS